MSFCLTCSALNRGRHLRSASWYTRCPAHSFYGFSSQTLLLSLVASLQPPEKPNFSEFNTTRSSTSSCLVTVTASDLKNSYNLSFINQDSAARSSRISCKIAWVDLFRWGEQLLKHRSIPWLSMVPAAASLSETWRDFVVHHFRPGQGKLQQQGYGGGEAVMPMCKYYVDHNHKVAQGRCDLSNTSPQACFYMYVSMQWQEY